MAPKKAPLSRSRTMGATATEGASYLTKKGKPDEDVFTRGQQKQIEKIKSETPPAKKARLSKATTMKATAMEAKMLLNDDELGDTRVQTQLKKKARAKKSAQKKVKSPKVKKGKKNKTAKKTVSKASLQKAGTMQNTAAEGKAFLKRTKKRK